MSTNFYMTYSAPRQVSRHVELEPVDCTAQGAKAPKEYKAEL